MHKVCEKLSFPSMTKLSWFQIFPFRHTLIDNIIYFNY